MSFSTFGMGRSLFHREDPELAATQREDRDQVLRRACFDAETARTLTAQPGWKLFESLLDKRYHELSRLLERDDLDAAKTAEARAKVKLLQQIADMLPETIRKGADAAKQLEATQGDE